MNEIWKDIAGYEGLYQVSNQGRIKSMARLVSRPNGFTQHRSERIMSVDSKSAEYLIVNLYKHGCRTSYTVHRLVAHAFIPNPENKPQINHKDGNKKNNSVENLEWATSEENIQHAYRIGLIDPNKIGEITRQHFQDAAVRNKHRAAIQAYYSRPESIEKCKERAQLHHYKHAVRCTDTGELYESVKAASCAVHRHEASLIHAIQCNTACAGLHWEYADS